MRCASSCVLSALALLLSFPSEAAAGSAAFSGLRSHGGAFAGRRALPAVVRPIGRVAAFGVRTAGPFVRGRHGRWRGGYPGGLGYPYGSGYPYGFGAGPFLLPGAGTPAASEPASPPVVPDPAAALAVPGIPNPPIAAPLIYVLHPGGPRRGWGGAPGADVVVREDRGGAGSELGLAPRIIHIGVRP